MFRFTVRYVSFGSLLSKLPSTEVAGYAIIHIHHLLSARSKRICCVLSSIITLLWRGANSIPKLHTLQLPLWYWSLGLFWILSRWYSAFIFLCLQGGSWVRIIIDTFTWCICRFPLFSHIECFTFSLEDSDTDFTMALERFLVKFTLTCHALDQCSWLSRLFYIHHPLIVIFKKISLYLKIIRIDTFFRGWIFILIEISFVCSWFDIFICNAF